MASALRGLVARRLSSAGRCWNRASAQEIRYLSSNVLEESSHEDVNLVSTRKISDLLATMGENNGNWFWCCTNDMVIDAVRMMVANNVGALLVYDFELLDADKDGTISKQELRTSPDRDAIRGIITERDYMKKISLEGRSSLSTKVGEIMTAHENVITVTPDTPIIKAMELMVDNHIRHVPVVDGVHMEGLVSIRDIVRTVLADHKEEVDRLRDFISNYS
mmetsp:Transcript_9832/g.34942  ORF Transcript_9832/g.34942 Transcript_9832/m.34942 type:complete len:220 (+) Transcript_9832:255-914(+)